MDFERDLNTAQRQAVLTTEGPVLVIAGAGSGKTRTIVYRLAHLVSQGVDPGSILLLTFTRKAAQEMLTRAGLLLAMGPQGISGVAGRHLPRLRLLGAAPVPCPRPSAFPGGASPSWTGPTPRT